MVIPLFDDLAFSLNLLFFKRPETNLINFLGKSHALYHGRSNLTLRGNWA